MKKKSAKKKSAKKKSAKKTAKKSVKKKVARKALAMVAKRRMTAWELRLYVAGKTEKSIAALNNLKNICETHLKGKYFIEVIDLLEQPQLAKGDQIVATPTLVKKLPTPVKRIIGDLSKTERVLVGLNLIPLRV